MWETWVRSLGWEDPLGEGMATHSSNLGWRIAWTEDPGGLQSAGSQRVRQDWATGHSTGHGATLRLGCPSEEEPGWTQIWEHGLLLNSAQGEEEVPGLLPCVRGWCGACSGVKGQDEMAIRAGMKGESQTLPSWLEQPLGPRAFFMVRPLPQGVIMFMLFVFSVTSDFSSVLVQRAALCRSATRSSCAKGNTRRGPVMIWMNVLRRELWAPSEVWLPWKKGWEDTTGREGPGARLPAGFLWSLSLAGLGVYPSQKPLFCKCGWIILWDINLQTFLIFPPSTSPL